jgi:ectoine hydroxylase
MSTPHTPSNPTESERFHFETQGYLVLENFITPEHVAKLLAAVKRVAAQRRREMPAGWKSVWPPRSRADLTHINGRNSTRVLNLLEDDPLFQELLDWPALMPYVRGLFNPAPHYHASDFIIEDPVDYADRGDGWHMDGHDNSYRNLGWPVPLLQFKVGIYLTDMTAADQGNLTLVPGSHKSRHELPLADRQQRNHFPGALQVCAPAGSTILFHNAVWHTAAPHGPASAGRTILYLAYEHPWMLGSSAHWNYSKAFYNERLTAEQRKLFHGFVFDPPEQRM